MIAVLATLAAGFIIGYLGQRSRFCIVSGIRDGIVIRNFYRIKGFIGILVGAFVAFWVFKTIGDNMDNFLVPVYSEAAGYWVASIIGGLGIGFFSVLAEGCPFRQHVMAAEGKKSAMFYLLGFYVGIFYFYLVTFRLLTMMVTSI